jgi:hypothetical protein
MPSFADVYNNAPPPSVHSTRHNVKHNHPTGSSHIPADAKPIDYRRMSSSKAGMGRTRGTERSSKPEEAPIGAEFAERTRHNSQGGISDGSSSPPVGSPSSPNTGRKGVFGAFERRRASSGSPRQSSEEANTNVTTTTTTTDTAPAVDKSPEENRGRRSSITGFLKGVFQ